MPIVVVTGLPASGKSTRARQLEEYLVSKGKKVRLISENEAVPKALYEKNAFFADSQKEKVVRSDLKSEASRQLNKDDVVILDAGNYIKGEQKQLTIYIPLFTITNFLRIPLRIVLHDEGGADHTVHAVQLHTARAGMDVQHTTQRTGQAGRTSGRRWAECAE